MILAEFTAEVNNIQVENLYQWDTNQNVKISGIDFGSVAPQVHFCNKKSETALAVQGILQSDGSVIASVPNSLLTEPYDITAYIYLKTGVIGNTIKCIVLPVIARQMPSDYVLTSDKDIVEIHEIELEAKAIIDNLTASAYSATESYKRPNIVYYDNGAYMCKSSTAVTGVAPTDTTVWQLLCRGVTVSSVTLNTSGDLVFTFDNGSTKTVAIPSTEAVLTDTVTNAEAVNGISFHRLADTYLYTTLDNGKIGYIPAVNFSSWVADGGGTKNFFHKGSSDGSTYRVDLWTIEFDGESLLGRTFEIEYTFDFITYEFAKFRFLYPLYGGYGSLDTNPTFRLKRLGDVGEVWVIIELCKVNDVYSGLKFYINTSGVYAERVSFGILDMYEVLAPY